MFRRIVCTAAAAVMGLSVTGCGAKEIRIHDRKATETAASPVVDAYTELESASDSSPDVSSPDSAAETTKKKKSKKKTETETTAEPEVPDVRRDQPYLGAADNDDFADACFIGASQTVGLSVFGNKVEPDFYAFAGLTVETVFTNRFISPDGKVISVSSVGDSDKDAEDEEEESPQAITVLEAMKLKQYKRIYLLFGLNELGGWIDYQVFYDNYVRLIRELKSSQPGATIYVQSMLPVNKFAVNTNGKYTNENIDAFNRDYVRKVANDTGVPYVNINTMLKCTNGSLPKDAATDGIHMTAQYCLEWMDMLAYYTPPTGMSPNRMPPEESDYSTEKPPEPAAPGESEATFKPVDPSLLPDVVIPDQTEPDTTTVPEETPAPDTEPTSEYYEDYGYDDEYYW